MPNNSASSPSRAVKGDGEEALAFALGVVKDAAKRVRGRYYEIDVGGLQRAWDDFPMLLQAARLLASRLTHASTPSSSTAGGSDISDRGDERWIVNSTGPRSGFYCYRGADDLTFPIFFMTYDLAISAAEFLNAHTYTPNASTPSKPPEGA